MEKTILNIEELNPNDLAIGWYTEGGEDFPDSVKINRPLRIASIDYFNEEIESTEGEIFYVKNLEPIELSADIFRLNKDWKSDESENAWNIVSPLPNGFNLNVTYALNDGYLKIFEETPDKKELKIKALVFDIHAIHILQHVLRICGYSNIANNFIASKDAET